MHPFQRSSNSSEIALALRTIELEDFAECPSRDSLYVSAIEYHKWVKSHGAKATMHDTMIHRLPRSGNSKLNFGMEPEGPSMISGYAPA